MGDLHEDIYFGDINKRYSELAVMSNEDWNVPGKTDNGILKNYLKYTYKKLKEESKIVEPNAAGGNQKYYLKGFMTPYELGEIGVVDLPERANYFDNPELLVFDAKCEINVQYKHILSDEENMKRIPSEIQKVKNLQYIFSGAIDMMKKKVSANYKIAVPQYFNGKIQLLLPLCLVDPNVPDLALVVTKNSSGNFYQGHTCLTLEMAYNNARLIAKPDSNWLRL